MEVNLKFDRYYSLFFRTKVVIAAAALNVAE